MPKTPINYKNTIIYKIVCNDLEIKYCYVGHTTNFTSRKRNHKSNCYNKNADMFNTKLFTTIREKGGWDNWSMIEVEKFPCDDLNSACKRERYWYEQLNADLNTYCPNRDYKEYVNDNRDKINKIGLKYRNNNREKEKERLAIYRANNKEKINNYYVKNKEKVCERVKRYATENKEKIKIKKREAYQKSKLQRLSKQNVPVQSLPALCNE